MVSLCVFKARHPQSIQNNKFAISLQYLTKKVSDEVDFLHANKHEGFLQIKTMVLIEMVKHSQSSQNSKFTMYLQYLKQEVRDEVDFLHVDKHQSCFQNFGHQNFLQFDTIIIDGHDPAFSKYSK